MTPGIHLKVNLKKYNFIVIVIGVGLLISTALFLWGKTSEKPKMMDQGLQKPIKQLDFQSFISNKKESISFESKQFLTELEASLEKNNTLPEKISTLTKIADFWKDSANSPEIYCFYLSEAAKLDNSEKNLTFAAQLFLDLLKNEHDESVIEWEASEAISLFEKAIVLNPSSDDLKIDLASCYVFGKGRNGAMKGITQLLEVVKKDSNNMKAQLVLGIGGFVSGQLDKAIYRLTKVVEKQPDNTEAIAFLADTYAAQGNKEKAIYWYNISKKLINNPSYSREVDKRIKELN